jgi:hypothetical protein
MSSETTSSRQATSALVIELAKKIRETPDRRMEALLGRIKKKHGAAVLMEALIEAHRQGPY